MLHLPPTPIESSSISSIFYKREDLSPFGSHKFRYFIPIFQDLMEKGIKSVVLSSTGNAGITASKIGKSCGIEVMCIVHKRADPHKASEIVKNGGFLIRTERPIRFSKYIAKRYCIPLLRVSKDPNAIRSYSSLGEEIIDELPDADAIINFSTSGTSTLGIAHAYHEKGLNLPAFHVVQAGRTSSVVKALHPDLVSSDSAKNSIGLIQTPYHEELLKLIKVSYGDAWYVTPKEIQLSQKELKSVKIETSLEGVCSFFVGKQILDRYKKIVVIFSGKKWVTPTSGSVHFANTFEDMDELWKIFSS